MRANSGWAVASGPLCYNRADFKLFDETPSWHTLHRILNVENGAWHMRGMEFHFIEMPKLRELHKYPQGTGSPRRDWNGCYTI